MFSTILTYLSSVIPTKLQAGLIAISSAIFSFISLAVGGFDLGIIWLFAFTVVDFISGTIAACKAGELSSHQGFSGLFKKVSIFLIVAVFHGLDVIFGTDFLRNGAIAGYAINEAISICENLDRLGHGRLLPEWIRHALKTIQVKQEEKFKDFRK